MKILVESALGVLDKIKVGVGHFGLHERPGAPEKAAQWRHQAD